MKIIASFSILFTVILGTIITISSSHLLLMWAGLELSMLAVIPILMKNHNPRSTEAATKYFLTQATASMIFLLGILINFTLSGQWTPLLPENELTTTLMTTAMLMKLGLAPFHFWVPEVTQGIPLMSGMLLLTWQKLAPISILYQLAPMVNNFIMLSTGILSIILGGWGGLNQTQLRKIMAYSSIAHMGWMIVAMTYNPTMTLINLIIYIMLTISMFLTINVNSNHTILSLSHSWNNSPILITSSLIILLSLGGLPPLSGFIPKWLIMQEMITNYNIHTSLLMATAALLNLFFYLRLIYSSSLTLFPTSNNMKMKWQYESPNTLTFLPTLTILSTLTLPIMPSLFTLN
uniref:NADH-ubiquinone oxidoreductase chain 2 n=1 Tax=Eozapus setchuanus TaxID=101673 RepID=A0A0H3UA20_9RODE|nr:NADH dehydrogenase subunit 2 [Eozapus setchuanus]AIG99655.1 NADH dehydrogenase subunit 2 [Eozapus setchuanus]